MNTKEQWIKRERFGKIKYMCGNCRKSVAAGLDQLKRMVYCPYCGYKKGEIKS